MSPYKAKFSSGRGLVTKWLRRISSEHAGSKSDPYYPPSREDLEDARYFNTLATKNQDGTLTPKEAQEILDMFEEENVVVASDNNGHLWVEMSGVD